MQYRKLESLRIFRRNLVKEEAKEKKKIEGFRVFSGKSFFSRVRKGMERRSLILAGFRRAFGQTPPGFRVYVQKRTTIQPPLFSPLRNPGTESPASLCSRWNGRCDKVRHKGKLSSTTRHGNRVAGRGIATREERNGRFIFQKGAQPKIYVYSHLLTRTTVFLRISCHRNTRRYSDGSILQTDRCVIGEGKRLNE